VGYDRLQYVSRKALERDEAVHLFEPDSQKMTMMQGWIMTKSSQENKKKDIEAIALSTHLGEPENLKRKRTILLKDERKILQ
jgi:hypothetical protein